VETASRLTSKKTGIQEMTTENNEQKENETKESKIGCGTILLITTGVIVLLLYLYINGLANGFANS
jgi:hypothetical protein